MHDAPDDALLAAMATGDRDAAVAFVRRFQQRVHGVAVGVLGDRGRAADVAQEAFVRAWRHAESFDPARGSVATWLLGITRHLAIDSLRAERSRPAVPVEELDLRLVATGPDPGAAAVTATDAERALAALGTLPPEQRRAVALAVMGGRTALEIAAVEGIPLGTAKTRVRTGLRRLRDAFGAADTPAGTSTDAAAGPGTEGSP